jgi:uncharacterized protein (DUF4415 family)
MLDFRLRKRRTRPVHKPIKTHASVRIDADVMAWLKSQSQSQSQSQSKGYQARMNAILCDAMIRSTHHKV